MVELMVTLKLRLGKKGYLIIPKILREKYGFKEGDWILVELRDDGIMLKPGKNMDDLRKFCKSHAEELRSLNIRPPKPGELKGISLEEEFE